MPVGLGRLRRGTRAQRHLAPLADIRSGQSCCYRDCCKEAPVSVLEAFSDKFMDAGTTDKENDVLITKSSPHTFTSELVDMKQPRSSTHELPRAAGFSPFLTQAFAPCSVLVPRR